MHSFKITNQFLLDDEPFTILSGAIHYMRVHPSDWHHSLYNLKALGFNTVETYVPWNLHEPKPGVFDFSGSIDLAAFLDEAASVCMQLFGPLRLFVQNGNLAACQHGCCANMI